MDFETDDSPYVQSQHVAEYMLKKLLICDNNNKIVCREGADSVSTAAASAGLPFRRM